MNRLRGEIAIPAAAALAGLTLMASVGGAYFTVQLSIQDKIAEDRIKIQANTSDITAEQTQINQTGDRMDRFENKLDALLINQGLNPAKYGKE